MSLEQKQIPDSTHYFDADNRTDGAPDYKVTGLDFACHNEFVYICCLPIMNIRRGNISCTVPLWRFNGAGPSDPKIPIILLYGAFSNRFNMDYGINGEVNSLARFLANRGRDVFVLELQQCTDASSDNYIDYMTSISAPWQSWYSELLFTTDPVIYANQLAYYNAQDVCSVQTSILNTDKRYTSTVDDSVFEDLPAAISAVLNITGQTQVQLIGHSIGATIVFGFLPTMFCSEGRSNAGQIVGGALTSLPTNSILSLSAVAAPTALIDCPPWLQAFKDSGQMNQAYRFRAKFGRYFTYLLQHDPKWPVKLQGVCDTAFVKHIELAIENIYFPFFSLGTGYPQNYHRLYDGELLVYWFPDHGGWYVQGHQVSVPVSVIYDGNGFDELGTWSNVSFMPNKLIGYKAFKPFFQYRRDSTCHAEMILGYNVEGGDPSWPTDLNYTAEGTYHFLWYDLNRYLPPSIFSAYCPDLTTSGDPLIAWQNLRDSVSFELWARQGEDLFVRKVSGVNSVRSAVACAGLSSGVWQIKVRAISLGGSWQDHSGASSIGALDDPSLYIQVTKS